MMRGKEKTLLKKGFSPSPAPLSSFRKLLILDTENVPCGFPAHDSDCRKSPSVPDTLCGRRTCTQPAELDGRNEFHLLAAVGATA